MYVSQKLEVHLPVESRTLNWCFISSEEQEFLTVSEGGGVRICNVFHNWTAIARFMLEYLSTVRQVTPKVFHQLGHINESRFSFCLHCYPVMKT